MTTSPAPISAPDVAPARGRREALDARVRSRARIPPIASIATAARSPTKSAACGRNRVWRSPAARKSAAAMATTRRPGSPRASRASRHERERREEHERRKAREQRLRARHRAHREGGLALTNRRLPARRPADEVGGAARGLGGEARTEPHERDERRSREGRAERPARAPRGYSGEREQEHEAGGRRQQERGLEEPELMVRERSARRVIDDGERQQEERCPREEKDREEKARRAFARAERPTRMTAAAGTSSTSVSCVESATASATAGATAARATEGTSGASRVALAFAEPDARRPSAPANASRNTTSASSSAA